jgi:hypothetical protein
MNLDTHQYHPRVTPVILITTCHVKTTVGSARPCTFPWILRTVLVFPNEVRALTASSGDDDDICTEIPTRARCNYRPIFPNESMRGKRSHSERFVPPRNGQLIQILPGLNELPQSLSLQPSKGWVTGLSTHTYMQVRSPESAAPEQSVVTCDTRAAVRDRPAAVACRQSHVRPYSSTIPTIPAQRNENETSSLEPSKNDVLSLALSMLQTACKRAGVSCSGSKAVLVSRLNKRGFTDVQSVRKLAEEYEANPAGMVLQGDFLNSGGCSKRSGAELE